MKPVNLLPAKSRPRTPTGSLQGSSYIVIGVLAAVLIMTLVYVTTVNDISSKKTAVAKAKAETQQAQARAGSLQGYGNFSQIKQQRVSSVEQLAAGRVDWERLARGLARVLPDGVWILTASASASGNANGAGGTSGTSGSSSSSSSSGTPGASPSGGPSVQLSGCAPSQDVVATTLVRLKELSGATDVLLNEVTQPDSAQTSGGSSGSGTSSGTDCGQSHGQPNYTWSATVAFAPIAGSVPNGSDKVPASLGGGA